MFREELSPLILAVLNSHLMFCCAFKVWDKKEQRRKMKKKVWDLMANGCEIFATLDMSRRCTDNVNVFWIELLGAMPLVHARIGSPPPKLMATWVEAFIGLTHNYAGCPPAI